jgi:hypothetical protein
MYFPYFRGRQYELLALRELTKSGLIGNSVLPVIEPVKLTSTLDSALKAINDASLSAGLVFNPVVGELAKNPSSIAPLYGLSSSKAIIPSIIFNESASICLSTLKLICGIEKDAILTILDNRDNLNSYNSEFRDVAPRFSLFPDERQIRRAVKGNKILFDDKFNKQPKNANYPEDEFFSEDHLYYAEEGYFGFGDYSIVGKDYNEGGWAPYAVVIHIIYFADDMTLRIKHFVSDSNDDTSDIAGKFYEAVSKLAEWYYTGQEHQITIGLQTYLNHYENRTYPGLPTLKKLSIMHHLELVGKFLDGKVRK